MEKYVAAGPLSDFLARYRLRLSFFAFVALVVEWQLDDRGRAHSLLTAQDVEHPLGLSLLVAGMLLRSWATGVIRKRIRLTTEGPYALVRHPLYLGSFLMAVGFALIMEDRLALAVVLAGTPLIYVPTIRGEERQLARNFAGAWDAYAARTGRVLPRFPLRVSRGEWSWQRWLANREWRVWFRTPLILLAIEWWNMLSRTG